MNITPLFGAAIQKARLEGNEGEAKANQEMLDNIWREWFKKIVRGGDKESIAKFSKIMRDTLKHLPNGKENAENFLMQILEDNYQPPAE